MSSILIRLSGYFLLLNLFLNIMKLVFFMFSDSLFSLNQFEMCFSSVFINMSLKNI